MTEEIKSFELEEYIRIINPQENYQDQVIVVEIAGNDLKRTVKDVFPMRFETSSTILVSKGELIVTMDYIPYTLTQHMVLERANVHLINAFQVSHDFKGYHIIFGRKILNHLFEEIVPLPKDYAISKRYEPVHKLDSKDFLLLVDIIERLRNNIRRTSHHFQKGLILNEVRNFIMELSDIEIRKVATSSENFKVNHLESLAIRFMQLLVEKCRMWHEVSDYSTELCVTSVYLSRTIKSFSGQTAMDWINKARIAEAKILLRKPDVTVQEVAEMLNFSDQSAFGKFFKKHTGKSPVEYKRQLE